MISKEALEKLSYIPIYEEDIDIIFKGDLCEVYRNEVDIISKDLDHLEKLEKENQELKDRYKHRAETSNDLCKIVEKDLDQLEEYKKIEEELGIDLITLVKMLKDDVYINDGGIVDEIGHIYKERVKSIEHWPIWGFTIGDGVEYAFKDRGKTWALDKEEFYRNIK